jgi:hypothetical protein
MCYVFLLLQILASCSYDNTIKFYKEDADGDDWSCVATLGKPCSHVLKKNPLSKFVLFLNQSHLKRRM